MKATRNRIVELTRGLSWRAGVISLLLLGSGCASSASRPAVRPFDFSRDVLAMTNELVWVYRPDPVTGKMTHVTREPPPAYSHHCFVLTRSARQFLWHARFDPAQAESDEATYRRQVREVIGRSPRHASAESNRVVIAGYADLRAFSGAHAALLQSECGGAWQSYFQRGHWRVVWPFSRRTQERMAEQLQDSIHIGRSPVVHLTRFPQLTINHSLLLFAEQATAEGIEFTAYDPNSPNVPAHLRFDRARREFQFARNDYFVGGRVNVYEVYYGWCY